MDGIIKGFRLVEDGFLCLDIDGNVSSIHAVSSIVHQTSGSHNRLFDVTPQTNRTIVWQQIDHLLIGRKINQSAVFDSVIRTTAPIYCCDSVAVR